MSRGTTVAGKVEGGGGRRGSLWRIAAWGTAALVLLIPLIAMRFTEEVAWSAADFVFAGVLMLGVGVAFEFAVWKTGNPDYRWAVGISLAAGFLLIWINGAVGIIGSEDNKANLMYGGVLAVGFVGALVARFRARGMALALFATAFAQAAVAVIALVAGLGSPGSGSLQIVLLNGFFIMLFVGSGLLFRKAASEMLEQVAV